MSDLTSLNVPRLLARLEHNLLSPRADLEPLRESEYHRMRVRANLEYARSLLVQLEQSLPQVKTPDRKHEIQENISKWRQILRSLMQILEEMAVEKEAGASSCAPAAATMNDLDEDAEAWFDDDEFDGADEKLPDMQEEGVSLQSHQARLSLSDAGAELESVQRYHLGSEIEDVDPGTESAQDQLTPPSTISSASRPDHGHTFESNLDDVPSTTIATRPTITTSTTSTFQSTASAVPTSSTLRNRHVLSITASTTTTTQTTTNSPVPATRAAISTALHRPDQQHPRPVSKLEATEQTIATQRNEQEGLTESLLSLAQQLKASSQAFHTSLEEEKSVLTRAGDDLDRTMSGMQAAERRMGMLRRITEGRGWWGRMMLYAWIFGLWLVALGIVFLGPKMRF